MIRKRWYIVHIGNDTYAFPPGTSKGEAKREIRKARGLRWYERVKIDKIERRPYNGHSSDPV